MKKQRNALASEESLHLKQHQYDLVNWSSYGPKALQKAKDRNLPLFLNIGDSTCHWCQVMGKESFNDPETAKFLNENFIPIKIDREEHPDMDELYQQASQLLSQTGGWPLNVFLLPDMRPFFAGTYFPKNRETSAHGERPSFLELLQELSRTFSQGRKNIEDTAEKVMAALEKGIQLGEPVKFSGDFPPPMAVMEAIKDYEDKDNGGHGGPPKFPHFPFYEWAIEQILEGVIEHQFGEHIVQTLENMLFGGLNDHARGGMHHYSTDKSFTIPHFEKTLYDQAGLLRVLAKFGLIYPSPLVYDALMNTLIYLETEMMDEKGFFFSSQGGYSEGIEGLFFTFTEEEFESALNKLHKESRKEPSKEPSKEPRKEPRKERETLKKWFSISQKGNFKNGLNVISLDKKYKEEFYSQENWEKVRKIRYALLAQRKERIPPPTDNKGLCSWNALILSALVDVIQYCQIDAIKRKANEILHRALQAYWETFFIQKGAQGITLQHSTTRERGLPYLEDFVTFSESMLRIFEITGNEVFKKNFADTITLILKEFFDPKEKKLYTRPLSLSHHELYPNLPLSPFDTAFKSIPMTLIHLLKRGRALFQDSSYGEELNEYIEEAKHFILKNPISGGEGLRALSYPSSLYRVVKCPRSWLEDGDFISFMSFFLPRFVLDCTSEEGQQWRICNSQECELQGEGLSSFKEILTPKEKPPTPAS